MDKNIVRTDNRAREAYRRLCLPAVRKERSELEEEIVNANSLYIKGIWNTRKAAAARKKNANGSQTRFSIRSGDRYLT